MWSGLQIFEVLLLHSCHHLVVVQVLLHLHVIWVGQEEGVGSRHCFTQLIDLKNHTTVSFVFSDLTELEKYWSEKQVSLRKVNVPPSMFLSNVV